MVVAQLTFQRPFLRSGRDPYPCRDDLPDRPHRGGCRAVRLGVGSWFESQRRKRVIALTAACALIRQNSSEMRRIHQKCAENAEKRLPLISESGAFSFSRSN